MKKILLVAGCLLAVMFESCTGCKEIGPSVNLTPVHSGNYDSVYTLTATEIASLTTDPHSVLIEEFTGQDCNNCPSAHQTLGTFTSVNVIGLYLYNIPQAVPPAGAIYDFRDSAANKIGDIIYGGVSQLPSGGVDRVKTASGNAIETARTFWAANIPAQKSVVDSMNLSLKSSFDKVTGIARIVATVTYTQPISSKQNLSVVIVEDGMIDLQNFPTGVQSGYRFTDVFRDMVSSVPLGDPILDTVSTKTRGLVLQRTFSYKLKTPAVGPAIIPDSCHVIGFINNTSGTDKRILQSAQTKLVQ